MENINAIESYRDFVKEVNEIVIPTFAVIITGYAIFQALVNGETLITLISMDSKERSRFAEYNYYFLGLSLLYLILIIFNLLALLIFKNMSKEWHLQFLSNKLNEGITSFLIAVYVTFVIHSLIELKSFIYNLFQCFNINAAHTAINHIKGQKNNNSE
ncbi:hypothetical protein [Alkalihalobacillus sp. BA299]|uniref:hypothetical protein n=1 Tax=Alkalihalobacillus sp. BA299 TaxID=2815938 RepID=UPI001ADC4795|nr:hypothetical protein [Alkalihalobacillus sp. BA299]